MTIDFTNLALAVIAVFGIFGWARGVRRIAISTGGVFFAMALVDLIGKQFVTQLAKVGLNFQPSTLADVFLAALFVFTVYIVQLFGVRMVLGPNSGPRQKRDRFNGILLGLVNGFLVVANAVRYADPFLVSTQSTATGGWSFHLLLPIFSHPDAGTFSVGVATRLVQIRPSSLVRLYDSLPTALVFLFAFLVFVFLGTIYGRVIRSRG